MEKIRIPKRPIIVYIERDGEWVPLKDKVYDITRFAEFEDFSSPDYHTLKLIAEVGENK